MLASRRCGVALLVRPPSTKKRPRALDGRGPRGPDCCAAAADRASARQAAQPAASQAARQLHEAPQIQIASMADSRRAIKISGFGFRQQD